MRKKEISLWVLEKEQPIKKPLVELILTSAVNYRIITETSDRYWSLLGVNFEPSTLVDKFLQTTNNIYELFRPFFAPNSTFPLYENIMAVDVAFAEAEVYGQRTKNRFNQDKEDAIKVEGIAHFHPQEGVVFSLNKTLSLREATSAMIHEYGHYLDYLLNPKIYGSKTATMREMMAILVQERFGYKSNYYKNTSHYRAQTMLRKLNATSFVEITFVQQWEFLAGILDHRQAEDYFENHLQERSVLNKIIDALKRNKRNFINGESDLERKL